MNEEGIMVSARPILVLTCFMSFHKINYLKKSNLENLIEILPKI